MSSSNSNNPPPPPPPPTTASVTTSTSITTTTTTTTDQICTGLMSNKTRITLRVCCGDHDHDSYLDKSSTQIMYAMEGNTSVTEYVLILSTPSPSDQEHYMAFHHDHHHDQYHKNNKNHNNHQPHSVFNHNYSKDKGTMEDAATNVTATTTAASSSSSQSALCNLWISLFTNRNLGKVTIINHHSAPNKTKINEDSSSSYQTPASVRILDRFMDAISMSSSIHTVSLHGLVYYAASLTKLLRFTRTMVNLRLDDCQLYEHYHLQHNNINDDNDDDDEHIQFMQTLAMRAGLFPIPHPTAFRQSQRQRQLQRGLPLDLSFAFMENQTLEQLEINESDEMTLVSILRNLGASHVGNLRRIKVFPPQTSNHNHHMASSPVLKHAIQSLLEQSASLEKVELVGFHFANHDDDDDDNNHHKLYHHHHHHSDAFPLDSFFIRQVLEETSIQVEFNCCHLDLKQYYLVANHNKKEQQSRMHARRRRRTIACCKLGPMNIVWKKKNKHGVRDYFQTLPPVTKINMENATTATSTTMLGHVDFCYSLNSKGQCQALASVLPKLEFPNHKLKLEIPSFSFTQSTQVKDQFLKALRRNSSVCDISIILHNKDDQQQNSSLFDFNDENNAADHYSFFTELDQRKIQFVCDRNKDMATLLKAYTAGIHESKQVNPLPISAIPKLLELALECDDHGLLLCQMALHGV